MRDQDDQVERATLALAARLPDGAPPEVLLTLGSGLSSVGDQIEDPVDIPMAALPGIPVSRVPGHTAVLRYGRLGGKVVLAQMGRVHLYEGYDAADVTRLVEVAAGLGTSTYIVTNAAGGLNTDFSPGDLMVISDQINLTGQSPLTGVLRDGAPVFLDMGQAYDPELREHAARIGRDRGASVREGIYVGLAGPAYETPAEVHMLRTMGADAVGMSTVLEVIAARAHGMQVLGVSSVTNVHRKGQATTHAEVLEVSARAAEHLAQVVLGVVDGLV